MKWGGVRSADYEGLSDTVIAIAGLMAESLLPADEVRTRVGEYVDEVLRRGPEISPQYHASPSVYRLYTPSLEVITW